MILPIKDFELKEYLEDFYTCFEQGYDFEVFLQHYLSKIGLDEVKVTQKTRDGGIDLTAIRYGVISTNDLDAVKYIIQAKCKKPSASIHSKEIDALRGVMSDGEKGLFVSTCNYTKDAVDKAENKYYKSRPIVLINGEMLIKSCIDNEIGFDYIPRINRNDIISMSKTKLSNNKITIDEEISLNIINKKITSNDVRARILRLPKEIKQQLDLNEKIIKVNVNGIKNCELTLDATKTYLAGVTDIYREYNLISSNGDINSKIVKMYTSGGVLNIIFDEN